MATWTSIANSAVDAGSPIDEALVTALRDNPTAQAEGASGAPAQEKESFATDLGVWVLLETVSIAASGHGDNIDFTDAAIANYNTLKIIVPRCHVTVDTELALITGNGGTFDTGTSNYSWATIGVNDSGGQIDDVDISDTYMSITGNTYTCRTGGTFALEIEIHNASNTSYDTTFLWRFFNPSGFSSGNTLFASGGGQRLQNAAHDRFRIHRRTASGEFQNGEAKIYGLLNS